MLYVNAYVVSRVWYSAAEGGCWYDAGEPIASLPLPTVYEKGKLYVCGVDSVRVAECFACGGTGETVAVCEQCGGDGKPCNLCDGQGEYVSLCEMCGEIPADFEAASRTIEGLHELLKDMPGRREELRIAVERCFARPFPERAPTYE